MFFDKATDNACETFRKTLRQIPFKNVVGPIYTVNFHFKATFCKINSDDQTLLVIHKQRKAYFVKE